MGKISQMPSLSLPWLSSTAAFGVYQEGKAEEAIEALKSMSSPAARVLRDGHMAEIDSKELVPGDIVALGSW